jgi:hypothetical protein
MTIPEHFIQLDKYVKFESNKGYDKDKRAGKYLPEWEKGRPWLKYVDDKGMVCTARTKFGKPNGMFLNILSSLINMSLFKVWMILAADYSSQNFRFALVASAHFSCCFEIQRIAKLEIQYFIVEIFKRKKRKDFVFLKQH